MKRLFFITVLLILVSQLSAQKFTLKGKVTDEAGESLVGASVQLKGTYLGTATNAKGEFIVSNLKQGDYGLIISFIGYEEQTKQVNLTKDLNLNFKLTARLIVSDEVIVSAIKANEFTPVAQTNLHKKDIENKNINVDIPFMLR